jgi:hypothetical protein
VTVTAGRKRQESTGAPGVIIRSSPEGSPEMRELLGGKGAGLAR